MTIIQSIILGIVQGLTEFLPVSSSAHLVLVPKVFGWNNLLHQSSTQMTFDVVLHFGSLLAILIYFRKDLLDLIKNRTAQNNKLLGLLAIGSIPAAIAGLFFEKSFEKLFGSTTTTAGFLIITGLVMLAAEYAAKQKRNIATLTGKDSLFIGLAQAIAIAPGISRSGSTISVGLMIGLSREASARFSFLLAIPVVFGAFLVSIKGASVNFVSPVFLLGLLSSFVFSYAAIKFLLGYLQKGSLKIFAAYCIAAGIIGVAWL